MWTNLGDDLLTQAVSQINDEVLNDIRIECEVIFTPELTISMCLDIHEYYFMFTNFIRFVSGIYSHDMSEHGILYSYFTMII